MSDVTGDLVYGAAALARLPRNQNRSEWVNMHVLDQGSLFVSWQPSTNTRIECKLSFDHGCIPGGGESHMKVTGMLVGKLELTPYRRPSWAWLRLYLTPKGDHAKTDN